jgi:hypothetical protein
MSRGEGKSRANLKKITFLSVRGDESPQRNREKGLSPE